MDHKKISELYTSSVKLYENEQYKEALDKFNDAIKYHIDLTNPYSAEFFLGRALVKSAITDSEGAIKDLEKAIEIDPKHVGSIQQLILCHVNSDSPKKAIDVCTQSIKSDPSSGFLFFERSKLKYLVDDYEGAKKDCNEAIKFDSNNGEIYAHSSRLKFESGDDLNDALADCNKALDLDFYEPAVFYFRGAIQRNIGDFEEAIKSCCIAIKLDPKSEEVYKEQILMLEESVQEKLTAISDETDFDAKEKLNSVLNLINEEKKSF